MLFLLEGFDEFLVALLLFFTPLTNVVPNVFCV